jgi:hypothetical protein
VAIAFLRLVNPGLMNADSSACPAIQMVSRLNAEVVHRPADRRANRAPFTSSARVPDPPRYMNRMLQACADVYSEYRSGDRA